MVPKLRFKEFNTEWREMTLAQIFSTFRSGKGITSDTISPSGQYPVYGGNGLRGYTDTYTHSGEYFLIGRQGALCGNITKVSGKVYISEHAIACQANIDNYTSFFAEKLGHLNLNRISESSAQPGLSVDKLKKMVISVPERNEQTKIADFLSSVDEKIALLNKQHDLLCQYKKGMMQKIFSQELRFKDDSGIAFPDWENQKLGGVAIFLKGKGVAKTDIVEDGERECIRYGELYTDYGEVISKIKSRTNQSLTDSILSISHDVLIPSSGETAIDISKASCVLSDGVILGGDLNIIRSKVIDGMFLSYYINSQKKYEIAQMAQGNSVVHLYAKQLAKTEIFYPCKKEQTKIANFLYALDDKIAVKKAELDKLKTWKQGLLQQMFV